jgi:hypothetical protein
LATESLIDDAPREHIDHHVYVHDSGPGRNIGSVTGPKNKGPASLQAFDLMIAGGRNPTQKRLRVR